MNAGRSVKMRVIAGGQRQILSISRAGIQIQRNGGARILIISEGGEQRGVRYKTRYPAQIY